MKRVARAALALVLVSSLGISTSAWAAGSAKKGKNLIPITLPVAQNGTLTWDNVVANYGQISQVAWQRVQDAVAANKPVNIPTTVVIGQNTTADATIIKDRLSKLNQLFAGFPRFASYTGLVYNAKDAAWAEKYALTFFKKQGEKNPNVTQNIKQLAEASCEFNGATPTNCGGGMAMTFKHNGSLAGGAFYGVQNTDNGQDYWTDKNRNVGPMSQVDHEAMHGYQFAQFFVKPFAKGENIASDQSLNFAPWWFSEGQANAIGIGTFIDNVDDYKKVAQDNQTRRPDSRASVPDFSAAGLKKFLTTKQTTGPDNKNWSLSYEIGMSAVETLVAIGGPQSTLALYALGGNGENWETAFKHVYGKSWDEASTVLSQVLAARYAANPMQIG